MKLIMDGLEWAIRRALNTFCSETRSLTVFRSLG